MFDLTPRALPVASPEANLARERWQGALAARGLAAPADDAASRLLEVIFGASPHLSTALEREPDLLAALEADGPDAVFEAEIRKLADEAGELTDPDRVMMPLRIAKRRLGLVIAIADITGLWALDAVTEALTRLAEATLGAAADALMRRAYARGDLEAPAAGAAIKASGLIILGMGKLGARELNYSSDIDLIILYDESRITSAKPDRVPQLFVRIARDLVRIMEERTGAGYVFRTDLRLRPDPGSTPLAVSVAAAEYYYGAIGQNWERAAMIKARPVAGDIEAGEAFLAAIRPFVWRRNLDFAAIRDVHAMKRQINQHSLKDKGIGAARAAGFNVKLGRGGIREIEFFVQTQQLIYGGREVALRIPRTVKGLWALVEAGRLPAATAEELSAAYTFLRTVEHRVQMVEDAQTHTLPESAEGLGAIAAFLGFATSDAFQDELIAHVDRVRGHYAALFEDVPSLSGEEGSLVFTGTEDDPETLATLRSMGFAEPARVAAIVRNWHMAHYRATRSTRARELLTDLVPVILRALAGTAEPDAAMLRFDSFLSRLPSGVQLFSLFQMNPHLMELLATIMGDSPWMAGYMANHPDALEAVLTPGFLDRLPGREELRAELSSQIAHARDFEDVLTLCQRFAKDHSFQAGLHALLQTEMWEGNGRLRAHIAETVLEGLMPAVEGEFARRHGRMPPLPGVSRVGPRQAELAVIGMGKLGGRELSPRSDLDLVLVYRPPGPEERSDGERPLSANEYYIKLGQRLISALTAQSGDGQLFEIDLRLRPSGNAGPPAVGLEAFTAYEANEAWTWEHMALTRARVVAGPPALAAAIEEVIHATLTRPRDPDRLLRDVAEMRERLDREFRRPNLWETKFARGGIVDIEFIAQYLQLRHAHENPAILKTGTSEALMALAKAGYLPQEDARTLRTALGLWLRVQAYMRITHGRTTEPASAPEALRLGLARTVKAAIDADGPVPTFEEAERLIGEWQQRCFALYSSLVAQPAASLPVQATDASGITS
ncbi:bifunctional [glutamine synthetase] adenylyltransferase/[glutamine synthetase]-adenylyl-L-tyrosine phosphorylase [Radicibacter daui]|uniref:bifunctional [glutamine synthetase] adenylyltransferase/[glutamine synthetase]-adenylyl-L-tyrosine phosphorylase n=1 Tax=Radicibacter daui TaxID=3064829 RepID=UPI004046A818